MSLLCAETPRTRRPIVMIGAGGIVCDAHLPAYRKAGFEVAAIYDKDLARAKSTAEKFGIANTPASLDEAASTAAPNAVFDIATPASAHLEILEQLPDERGVLLQKTHGGRFGRGSKHSRSLSQEKADSRGQFSIALRAGRTRCQKDHRRRQHWEAPRHRDSRHGIHSMASLDIS